MTRSLRRVFLAVAVLALPTPAPPANAAPEGTLTWAKSPWHDRRVRQAANLAIDREGINQAAYLGLAKVASGIIPSQMDYFWQPPASRNDAPQARKLLAEAGYPNGFDARDLSGDMIYGSAIGEPSINYLNAVGIGCA